MSIPVVILAGGLGTRLREETEALPKPMVNIGERPIIWHIMKHYSISGFNEFVICLGYKGEVLKRFFLEYAHLWGDVTIDLATGKYTSRGRGGLEPWTVHLLETGLNTMTGGRILRAANFLEGRRFMATYGDGVSDVDINKLLDFHVSSRRTVTLTAVRPAARFGGLVIEDNVVTSFEEKPQIGEGWVNGGFMVLEPEIAKMIGGDDTVFEREPLEMLSSIRQLGAFRHEGFWQCMDTIRDLSLLRQLWDNSVAPWKTWDKDC